MIGEQTVILVLGFGLFALIALIVVAVVVVALIIVAVVLHVSEQRAEEERAEALAAAERDAEAGFGGEGVDAAEVQCADRAAAAAAGEEAPEEFELVSVEPGDQKWYVNMDEDDTAHNGRMVTITATISPVRSGINVYFTVVPGADNRIGLAADDQGSLSHDRSATNDEGKARTRLRLTTYGGDEFRVSASLQEDAELGADGTESSGNIVVWRRMYYEIAEMRKPTAGQFEMAAATVTMVRNAYANVFVEMSETGTRDVGDHHANFNTHDDGYTWADGFCSSDGVPFKIHYVIVDHLCPTSRREEVPASFDCAAVVNTPNNPYFRPFDFDGAEWLISAQYRNAEGSFVDFPAGKVTRTIASGYTKLRVDFTAVGVTPTAESPVPVNIRYYKAPGYNGWGGANLHLVICRGSMEEAYEAGQIETIMAGTSVHEPGHSLGLVYGSLAWKSAAHSNHCNYRDCVMWYQGYSGRPRDFHDETVSDPGCRTFLRGKDMTRSAMGSTWQFPR
ncbi:MAG: hypothetical protein HQ546_06805 [Planctomycetes bacterium]|nr:hypothetical protein [Planctomycetota bacterium]